MKKVAGVPVAGPLALYVKGFQEELERFGYRLRSTFSQLRLIADLSRWLAEEGLDSSALTPTTVDAFIAKRRAAGNANGAAWALRPLVEYLRGLGVAPLAARLPLP